MEDHECEVLLDRLEKAELQFKWACEQVKLLNTRMDDVETRYLRAKERGQHNYINMLQQRLAMLDEVRMHFGDILKNKAQEIEDLRIVLFEDEASECGETEDVITA